MALKTEEIIKEHKSNTITYIYVFDEGTPKDKALVYKINKDKKHIEFFPRNAEYYFFNKIDVFGFSSLPEAFNKKGYIKNNLLYYLNTSFSDKKVKGIKIVKSGKSTVYKRARNKYLHINYADLKSISETLGSINYYHNSQKSLTSNKFFSKVYPTLVKQKRIKVPKHKIKQALGILALNDSSFFDPQDIAKIINVLKSLLKTKYKSQIKKSELFRQTKLKIDTIALEEIVDEFKDKFKKKTSESKWGDFLRRNLFLIDSKYIHVIPELNVVLGGTRKVDFGLVDIHGYLDIYEIKKPDTKLLKAKTDGHGNYSWHNEAIESLVQAEKYHYHAERKSSNLEDDIKREKDIALEIKRPRAFVIMGNSDQLNNTKKKEDFQILRRSLKNIEIILYDELLKRIENQKKSAKIG